MKLYLPLLSSVLILASCTTAYKTGYTPDDVYFSPEREREEYVRVEEKDDREYRGQLQSEEEWREDRYLRMKTSYRRYSTLDDYDSYCYNGNNYNRYYNYYGSNNWAHYNPTFYWNSYRWNRNYHNPFYYNPYYNNPYYSGFVVGNVNPVYNKPRGSNLHTYDNSNNYNPNYPKSNGRTYTTPSTNTNDNYRGSGTNAGGFLRNVFGSGNNSNSNSNTNSSANSSNSNSSSSSSNSSNSSKSSGSSSAPVRKF